MRTTWKATTRNIQGIYFIDGFMLTIFSMEMWRHMVIVVHVDNNSKEFTYARHRCIKYYTGKARCLADIKWEGSYKELPSYQRFDRVALSAGYGKIKCKSPNSCQR